MTLPNEIALAEPAVATDESRGVEAYAAGQS
jgi:hypothetical protein